MNDQQTLDENRTQKRLSNMNTQTPYGLLLRSHETGRSILETVIYAVLGVCVMVSIVQFAQQPSNFPMHVSQHQLEQHVST